VLKLRAVSTAVLVLVLVGSVQTSWAQAARGGGRASTGARAELPAAGIAEGPADGSGSVGAAVRAAVTRPGVTRPGVAGGAGEPAGKVWPAERRVRELPGRRTANGRFFQLADGRVQAEISAGPVNYRDSGGRVQPIDTAVRPVRRADFAVGNATNVFTSLFGTSSGRLVRVEQGGRQVEVGLAGPARAAVPRVAGSTVTYAGLAGGADVVYEVTAGALKEQIVLRAAPPAGQVAFSFLLRTGGLLARQGADGSVEFVRPSGGAPVFVMPAPFMYDDRADADSPYGKVFSAKVSQQVEQHGGLTTVTVRPDPGWLADPARVYPVVVDPTIKVQPVPTDGQDVQIYSGATTTNYNNTYQLKVGTDATQAWRTLVRFPLTGVPAGSALDAARLELFYSQTHTAWGYDVAMEARRVTQPWSEDTATWANTSANIAPNPAANMVRVDDGDPGTSVVGTWPYSTNPAMTPFAINADYRYNNDATTGHTHTWVPTITESGDYQVEVHYTSEADRPTSAPYTVYYGGGQKTYQVDQTGSPAGEWKTLGVHPFLAGTTGKVVLGDVANKAAIADAVRFTRWGVATKKRAISSVWSSFPVRDTVQQWVNGTQPNNGFMIKAVDETPTSRGGPIFEGAEYFYQNGGRDYNLPRLVLTWGRPGVTLSPPTTVTATGAALSWSAYTDPSGAAGDNLVEYQVHRSLRQSFTPSAATLLAPLPPGALSYQDTSATPTPADTPDTALGHYYYYMVAVKTADGQVIAAPTEGVRLPKAGRVTRIFRTGVVDSTLSKQLPDANVDVYDGDPYVSAGNNSTFYGDTRGLVKFPTLTGIPAGAQVTDAQLRMWNNSVFPGTVSDFVDVHRLTRAFTETTATWNKADATTAWTTPGGDYVPAALSGVDGLTNDPEWQRWDVKAAVNTWLATPAANYGLLLKMRDEVPASARVMLLASEGTEPMLRPTLEVTYLEPTPAATYHAPYTPARMIPGDTTTVPVTVSNPTLTAWNAADWELSYHWTLPDGTDATTGGNQVATPLPKTIVPGDTVDVSAQLKAPIQSGAGNKRTDYVLKWELHNRTTGQWLSTVAGIASLDQNVAVEDPTSDQLGLEKFYSYTGIATGAGGTLMNNLYAGNTVWSYNAFANPSRGLATFVRLAYNSQDTSDTIAGFGWSLQASSLMRLGTPLDFHPNPNPTTVTLTDGDGTSHSFTWDPAAGQWRSPKGVHLFLQRYVVCDPRTEESRAWSLTAPDRTQFFYDCDGYLSSVADNNGNVMSFTYEVRRSQNKPTKFLRYLTDPVGRQTLTIDYWAKGETYNYIDDTTWTKVTGQANLTNPHIIDHVKQITDISGRTLTFTDKGLLGELIDGAGSAQPKTFAFRYDMTQGNKNVKLVRVTDPRGHATMLDYYSRPEDDPKFKWNTKAYADRLTNPTQFAYTDPDGQAGSQIQTTVTDGENHATTYQIDGFGRPTQITDAKNQTTRLAWDADNNVTRLEEANGAFSTWAYDPRTGYPTEIKDAEANANNTPGTTLTYQTQLDGHIADLIAKRSPEGRTSSFGYTLEGDLATVTDPLGTSTPTAGDDTTTYTYDTSGQLLTATDANGHASTNSNFDPNGYPQTITNALGKATTFTYDARGQVIKVVDPLLKDTTQSYDIFGRPLVKKVPKDLNAVPPVYIITPAPVYDANDNVTTATAVNGAVSTAAFDDADQLSYSLAPVDSAGDPQRKTSFTYDRVGNLLTTTEPKGNLTTTAGDYVTTNTYDEIYQLTSVTNAGNNRIRYEYDNVGNLVTVVDPRENATADPADYTNKYTYDRAHRVIRSIDALGRFTTGSYDRDGLLTATTDQLGNTTTLARDARGMQAEVKVPHASAGGTLTYRTTRYEYDQVGNRTRVISPRGVATTDDPDDFAQVTAYDELNRVKETQTAFDRDDPRYTTPDKTTYSYDDVGRLATLSAPPSSGESVRNNTTYTYFDNGWTKASADPWDIVTSYDYNELGSQTLRKVTSAGGSSSRTMSWQYHPDGTLKARSDDGVPVGKAVVLVDNSDFNNTTATGSWPTGTSAAGRYGPSYATNAAGTGADAFTWRLNVPQAGTYEVFVRYPAVSGAATDARFTVAHGAGSTVTTVNQTANAGTWVSLGSYPFTEGNTHTVTLSDQAGGTVVADAVKLVRNNTGETDTEKHDYTYAYDPNGNLTTLTDASPGARVDLYTIGYTGLNQVGSVQESKAGQVKNTTSFTYDENGEVRTSAHDKQYARYDYDALDLVSQVSNGRTATDPNPKVTTYTYTDRGERSREVKGNGNTVDYTYFLDGLLDTQVERKPNGTVVSDHDLDYDLNGNRTRDVSRKMNADNHAAYLRTTTDYTYDPRDRVASVTRTGDGAGTEAYVYDANGNVISQTVKGVPVAFNYDRNRLLTSAAGGVTASYNYDPYGRLDTVTAAGIVLQRNVYDGFDHIVENRKSTGTATTTTKLSYDPLDRTSTKVTDAGTAQEKTTDFNYLGLSSEVLDEEVAGIVEKSYQYAPWGERLSQTKRNSGGTGEDAYYGYSPHTDVEQLTDGTGDTKATYGYTAYGSNDDAQFTGVDKPDPQDPTKQPYNAYRYNAKRWDQASGNYDMGFRDYSPGLNRFLSRDSYNGALADMRLGISPWTGNRYSFAGGNPITGVEIDGHCWDLIQGACDVVSGAVDTVGNAAESAWNWTAGAAGAAWDWAWETGSDFVSAAGNFLGDVGDWVAHNADALGAIALDALEMIGGAAATIGGGALIVAGVGACAASTPLVLTGVGAVVTGGVCWGGLATAAAGVGLAGIGIAAMVDGGSGLGDDMGRVENPPSRSSSDQSRVADPGEVADRIAEHAGNRSIPGVSDEDLPEYLENIMRTPGTKLRSTPGGNERTGWWDPDTGTMVIREGNGGTFFQPDRGYDSFLGEVRQ
jgi:RHS repeat-associated protein